MSSEGAIGISNDDRQDLKFNRLEIPYSYSLQHPDPPSIQLKQINYRSFIIYDNAEGATCISPK